MGRRIGNGKKEGGSMVMEEKGGLKRKRSEGERFKEVCDGEELRG